MIVREILEGSVFLLRLEPFFFGRPVAFSGERDFVFAPVDAVEEEFGVVSDGFLAAFYADEGLFGAADDGTAVAILASVFLIHVLFDLEEQFVANSDAVTSTAIRSRERKEKPYLKSICSAFLLTLNLCLPFARESTLNTAT